MPYLGVFGVVEDVHPDQFRNDQGYLDAHLNHGPVVRLERQLVQNDVPLVLLFDDDDHLHQKNAYRERQETAVLPQKIFLAVTEPRW